MQVPCQSSVDGRILLLLFSSVGFRYPRVQFSCCMFIFRPTFFLLARGYDLWIVV